MRVELNPLLTPELVLEGWWNEIRHHAMMWRKEHRLTKEDKISVALSHILNYEEAKEIANKHNENFSYNPSKGWFKKNTQEKH